MLRILLVSLLFLTQLFSQSSQKFPFIGLSASAQIIDLHSNNEQSTSIGLRYGKQTLDWRTIFSYDYSKECQTFSVEIDKILLDELFGTPKVRPYLGANVGILKLDYDSLVDTNGYYYGANTGFIFYASDNIDIDLTYHYYAVQGIESVDKKQGLTLAIHYFY